MGNRAFLAHSMTDSDTLIWQAKMSLQGLGYEVIRGKEDWEANYVRCGGWRQWARDAMNRKRYASTEKEYTCVVCVSETIGSATHDVCLAAFSSSTPVYVLEKGKLYPVYGFSPVSYNDFYELKTER